MSTLSPAQLYRLPGTPIRWPAQLYRHRSGLIVGRHSCNTMKYTTSTNVCLTTGQHSHLSIEVHLQLAGIIVISLCLAVETVASGVIIYVQSRGNT